MHACTGVSHHTPPKIASRFPSHLHPVQFPPRLDPVRWSSGLPRLLLSAKDKEHGLAAGAQLRLLRTDTSGLKAALRAMPDTDWNGAWV